MKIRKLAATVAFMVCAGVASSAMAAGHWHKKAGLLKVNGPTKIMANGKVFHLSHTAYHYRDSDGSDHFVYANVPGRTLTALRAEGSDHYKLRMGNVARGYLPTAYVHTHANGSVHVKLHKASFAGGVSGRLLDLQRPSPL